MNCFKLSVIILIITLLTGCGGSPVDDWLDSHEAVIEKYEGMAGKSMDVDVITEISQLNVASATQAQKLKTSHQWTKEQTLRFIELQGRLIKAIGKMSH